MTQDRVTPEAEDAEQAPPAPASAPASEPRVTDKRKRG